METYGRKIICGSKHTVSPPKEGGKEAAHKKRARQIPGVVPVNTIQLGWMVRDSNVPIGNVGSRQRSGQDLRGKSEYEMTVRDDDAFITLEG